MNALRLIPGARIGIRAIPIEEVHVEITGPDRVEGAGERAVARWLQTLPSWCRTQWIEYQVDLVPCGCPHAKRHTSIIEQSAEGGPPRSMNADALTGDQHSDCDFKLLRLRARRRRLPYKRGLSPVCTGVAGRPYQSGQVRGPRGEQYTTVAARPFNAADIKTPAEIMSENASWVHPGAAASQVTIWAATRSSPGSADIAVRRTAPFKAELKQVFGSERPRRGHSSQQR
jgi:hypothetical protein